MAVAAFAWSLGSDVGALSLALFKIGAVAFGNGTTIIPLIQADVVDANHWLTLNQFADGIALGQITPGPFLITAAFTLAPAVTQVQVSVTRWAVSWVQHSRRSRSFRRRLQ